ncbi:MAG: 30S ribosomal protein S19e [Halobacteriota archaeon]
MTTAQDVPADDLIERAKRELEETDEIDAPDWAAHAKTGRDRELPPEEDDWWSRRAASLLRKVYVEEPVGVSALRRIYGGRDRSGSAKSHQTKASGNVIRTALQQLEDAGYVDSTPQGRVITPEGRRFLDGVADEVASEIPELEGY